MTQEDLADRAGVSARHIRDMEAGRTARPRAGTVRLVAEALGLDGADRDQFYRAALGEASDAVDDAPPPSAGIPPAQLPMITQGFAGRLGELAELDGVLEVAGERPAAVVLSGTPGVGKTALAVHWANRVRGRFPDGQLYVNLRGFDPSGSVMPPAEAIGMFLESLDVSPERVPAGLDARSALYRSLLAGRRMLVVLDNARDGAQVRPILPGSPGCLVVITSRDAMTGLVAAVGAVTLAIDLMTPTEAHRLLVHRLGPDRVAAEPAAVTAIIHHCAQLPLALAVVAAHTASRPGLSLTAVAAELRTHDGGGLDPFADPDPVADVRAVFSWSYRALGSTAARTFRLLGAHPGPHLGAPAVASLAGVSLATARAVVDELARAHLITEPAPGRYALHDLLHAYAAELGEANSRSRDAALRRVLDHYLHTACAAGRRLHPSRDRIPLGQPRPGVTVPEVPDHRYALSWFATEHPVLLAAIGDAARTGLDGYAWQLAWAMATYLDRSGHWHELAATQEIALAATRRLDDRLGESEASRLLGLACVRLGRYGDARVHLKTGLDLAAAVADEARQGHCHMNLAQVSARQGHHADALSHAQQARARFEVAGHRYGQASALNAIGWYHAQLDQYQEALTSGAQALPLLQEIGDGQGQAAVWDTVGYAHHRLGDNARAVTCYQRAIALYQEAGDRFFAADTLVHLGDAHLAAGDPDNARLAWRHALAILDDLGHPSAGAVRTRLAP